MDRYYPKRYCFLLLSLFCYSQLANATFLSFLGAWENPSTQIVSTFSVGPVWENTGSTQTFYLNSRTRKTYTANYRTHALFAGELFFGLQTAFNNQFQGQLGLEVAATTSARLSGNIWDDANPKFNNYTYNYQIQHTRVALAGKLLMQNWEGPISRFGFTPWIGASLGVGFNDAHGFENIPTIFEAVKTPNFKSHTETSFAYTLKVGVQKILNARWQVGANYEFADWGDSHLDRSARQTLGSGLTLNHLYTNGILFNLTYFA